MVGDGDGGGGGNGDGGGDGGGDGWQTGKLWLTLLIQPIKYITSVQSMAEVGLAGLPVEMSDL